MGMSPEDIQRNANDTAARIPGISGGTGAYGDGYRSSGRSAPGTGLFRDSSEAMNSYWRNLLRVDRSAQFSPDPDADMSGVSWAYNEDKRKAEWKKQVDNRIAARAWMSTHSSNERMPYGWRVGDPE